MLGANEVQELTVVTNGYTGEYGRAAGANMNITTKGGANQFHGDATWLWNGRALNANDYFSNANGAPRPFANSNQWAGSIGAPINTDTLFFFCVNEAIRYALPRSRRERRTAVLPEGLQAIQQREWPFTRRASRPRP